MRVTVGMFKLSSQRQLEAAQKELIEAQSKLSNGLEVSKPSDDPLRFVTAARFKSLVKTREQYTRNASDARRFLDNNEAAVGRISELLQRVRVLVIQTSNDSLTTADMQLPAKELRQHLESLINFANASGVEGKVFGGTKTDADPFEAVRDANGNVSDVIYRGNREAMSRIVSESDSVDVNFVGSRLFQIEPDQADSSFTPAFPGQGLAAAGFPAGDSTGYFRLQGERVYFDTAQDSLLDVADRINDKVPDAVASVTGDLTGTAVVASSSAATAATAGTFTMNGSSISISAGASLDDVVDAINAATDSTGVTASAVAAGGGFSLRLSGGVEITDTGVGATNALQLLGATSGGASPTNLTSTGPLAYALDIRTRTPDQIFATDEGSGRFLQRLGILDGTSNQPANIVPAQEDDFDIFRLFIDTIADMEAGDTQSIRTDRLSEMDVALEKFRDTLGDLGGLRQRVTAAENREEEFILQAKSVISANEDLDVAKAISDLQRLQMKLQAAIGASSNLPSGNLLNFL